MAKFVNEVKYFDNDFKAVESKDGQDIYLEKSYKQQILLGGKRGAMQNLKFFIRKGEKSVELSEEVIKRLMDVEGMTLEKVFNEATKNNSGTDKVNMTFNMTKNVKNAGIIFGVVGLIGAVAMFFVLSTNKNFTGEILTFDNPTELVVGTFVETDAELWDGYGIEIETVNSNYGIETSRSTSQGNTYVLMSKQLDLLPVPEEGEILNVDTFIFLYGAKTPYADQFESLGYDEYLLADLQGEVKDMSAVESVDSGPTATEYFEDSIQTLNADWGQYGVNLKQPEFIIDGNVTQANLVTDVLPIPVILAIVGIAGIAVFFVFNQKHTKEMSDFVNKVSGKQSSPIEK